MSNEEIPYQVAPQVEALKQERANCVAYGQEDRVAAIDKQLASLGVKQEAAEKRSAAADSDAPKTEAPKGRRSRESTQTQTGAKGTGEV